MGEGGEIPKILQRILVLHVMLQIFPLFLIFCGPSAQLGPRQPNFLRFCITHYQTH